MTQTVLLVEDDENIMKINHNMLSKAGYRVLKAENLREAEAILAEETPGVIVLDILLPDGNGIDWCRRIRGEGGHEPPILFLSAKKDKIDVLEGHKAGGDDYMTKPYDLDILLVKIETLLERAARVPRTVKKGTLRIETSCQQAFVGDEDLMLTQKEFALLLFFVQRENQPMSAEYLYEQVWGRPMAGNDSSFKMIVSNVRKKLQNSGYTISVKRGEGYCFEPE